MKLDIEAIKYIIDVARSAGFICKGYTINENEGKQAEVTLKFTQEEQTVKAGIVPDLPAQFSVTADKLTAGTIGAELKEQPKKDQKVSVFDTLDD